ncbi:hypothetical protein DAPK24_006960 [Pichia kluyveri]|uniref:Uncharacterized protein n=1 Tax=Pichia kluyveri TaxID=36015 RepID=A0AAV5QYT8_PICKL|nr:hypothetical protein DAPK24_006960 [Pichia kluyveri]
MPSISGLSWCVERLFTKDLHIKDVKEVDFKMVNDYDVNQKLLKSQKKIHLTKYENNEIGELPSESLATIQRGGSLNSKHDLIRDNFQINDMKMETISADYISDVLWTENSNEVKLNIFENS